MLEIDNGYLALITSEYYNCQKFQRYVAAFLSYLTPIIAEYRNFDVYFNIDFSTGEQLDMIGKIFGISRVLGSSDQRIPSILQDEDYRLVLKAEILSNHWNGTVGGLEEILKTLFPSLNFEIVDNQNMSYTVALQALNISEERVALIENGYILPKPAGIGVTYIILEDPAFGWDVNSEFFKGWDEGTWMRK